MARRGKKRNRSMKDRQEESAKNREGGGGFGVLNFSGIDNVKRYKPKEGTNLIDLIPFEVTQDWYAKLKGFSGKPIGKQVGDLDYKLEIPVHRNVGAENKQVVCLRHAFGKSCCICDERDNTEDQKIKASLKVTWRVIYNVIDLNSDEEEVIEHWEVSYHLFEKELLDEAVGCADGGEEMVYYADPDDGYSISFRGKMDNAFVSSGGRAFMKFKSINFKDRDEISDDLIDNAYPLDSMLIIPSPEEVQRLFFELDDEDEKETKPKSRQSRKEEEPEEDIPLEPGKEEDTPDEPPQEDTECPHNLTIGDDFDGYDVCDNCDLRNDCEAVKIIIEEEQGEKEKPKPKKTAKKTAKKNDNDCPSGHSFGKDFNKEDDCQECPEDSFDSCGTEQNKAKKEEKPKRRTRK